MKHGEALRFTKFKFNIVSLYERETTVKEHLDLKQTETKNVENKPETDNPTKDSKTESIADVRSKLQVIADAATDEEKRTAQTIVDRARDGKRRLEMFDLTPAICAILFLSENGHNRDFSVGHASEFRRRMYNGMWKQNNATIGFYRDGNIADGQHRLAAAALSDCTLEQYGVVFGMSRDSIDTVDSPKVRDGASHAALDGIQAANLKQAILKAYAAYMSRTGGKEEQSFILRSATEVKTEIEENDHLLDACIRMGAESIEHRIHFMFSAKKAASLAYILVKNGWPESLVREKLFLLQASDSQDGTKSVYYAANTVLEKSRKSRDKRFRLTGVKELGVAVRAVVQSELGKTAKASGLKGKIHGKNVPNPRYPGNGDNTAEKVA